jgi:glucose/arabinose dehydrogenase
MKSRTTVGYLLAISFGLVAELVSVAQSPPPSTFGPAPRLPPPKLNEEPAINFATVVGWKDGQKPQAPPGFEVTLFAGNLDNPRWLYVLPNGDVLVAESRTEKLGGEIPPALADGLRRAGLVGKSANRITLLRDANGDGLAEVRETFAANLNLPFGMLLLADRLYIANTDAVVRFRYTAGDDRVAKGEKILDLPAGGYNNHWTRNIVARPDGSKIYVSVGSQTNVDEEKLDAKEPRRAAILEANPDGTGTRLFATGLRNPNGMDWAPGTTTLWTVVNERDLLGDDLVPDYLTSVKDGAFYGWPFSYFGQHEDPRHKGERPDLVAKAVAPDYALGPHTASLGLRFYRARAFPEAWREGAFVGQHGSWNRSSLSGYKVIFVPFRNGRPAGPPRDFLTGFIASPTSVYGRPVGVTELPDGSLLVADDAGNSVWRVRWKGR